MPNLQPTDTSREKGFYNRGEEGFCHTNFFRLGDPHSSPEIRMNSQPGYLFEIDGKGWLTSEHYFQAMKFEGNADQEKIRNLVSPGAVFTTARRMKMRSNWEEHDQKSGLIFKEKVMLEALCAKYVQRKELGDALLNTGNEYLAEHSTGFNGGAGDDYWGSLNTKGEGPGQNRLGIMLTEVRRALNDTAGIANPQARQEAMFKRVANTLKNYPPDLSPSPQNRGEPPYKVAYLKARQMQGTKVNTQYPVSSAPAMAPQHSLLGRVGSQETQEILNDLHSGTRNSLIGRINQEGINPLNMSRAKDGDAVEGTVIGRGKTGGAYILTKDRKVVQLSPQQFHSLNSSGNGCVTGHVQGDNIPPIQLRSKFPETVGIRENLDPYTRAKIAKVIQTAMQAGPIEFYMSRAKAGDEIDGTLVFGGKDGRPAYLIMKDFSVKQLSLQQFKSLDYDANKNRVTGQVQGLGITLPTISNPTPVKVINVPENDGYYLVQRDINAKQLHKFEIKFNDENCDKSNGALKPKFGQGATVTVYRGGRMEGGPARNNQNTNTGTTANKARAKL